MEDENFLENTQYKIPFSLTPILYIFCIESDHDAEYFSGWLSAQFIEDYPLCNNIFFSTYYQPTEELQLPHLTINYVGPTHTIPTICPLPLSYLELSKLTWTHMHIYTHPKGCTHPHPVSPHPQLSPLHSLYAYRTRTFLYIRFKKKFLLYLLFLYIFFIYAFYLYIYIFFPPIFRFIHLCYLSVSFLSIIHLNLHLNLTFMHNPFKSHI